MQLQLTDIVVGTGAEAVNEKTVVINYTGTFEDGRVFDSSVGRDPIEFPLGAGWVIAGWDQGIVGMKVGGQRHLVIPGDLAYGAEGRVNPQTGEVVIPPDETLIFDVELVGVK